MKNRLRHHRNGEEHPSRSPNKAEESYGLMRVEICFGFGLEGFML